MEAKATHIKGRPQRHLQRSWVFAIKQYLHESYSAPSSKGWLLLPADFQIGLLELLAL